MAFVPTSTFAPGLSDNSNWLCGHQRVCKLFGDRIATSNYSAQGRTHRQDGSTRRATIIAEGVTSRDAMEFFRNREGTWRSYRTTHHLAFRQSETGESVIKMKCLDKTDERVVQLCKDNNIEPERAQGGCYVTWKATLAWDGEGENHEGETVFALVPEENDIRKGKMLRDRGYAEIIPIAGTYYMDEIDDLNLETPYEGGAVVERFSFDGPDYVNRLSTVRRFGGLSTATFATEERIKEGSGKTTDASSSKKDVDDDGDDLSKDEILKLVLDLPVFSVAPNGNEMGGSATKQSPYRRTSRWATTVGTNAGSQGIPSASSAFSSGFGGASGASTSTGPRPPSTSAFSSGFGETPKITSKPFAGSGPHTEFSEDGGQSSSEGGIGSIAEGVDALSNKSIVTDLAEKSNTPAKNGNGSTDKSTNEETLKITPEVEAAAKEIGIDLYKVPPSMRDGYVRSFYEGMNKEGGDSDSS